MMRETQVLTEVSDSGVYLLTPTGTNEFRKSWLFAAWVVGLGDVFSPEIVNCYSVPSKK